MENEAEQTTEETKGDNPKLTPELVRQITDRVYDLWRKELQIENERRRIRQGR